MAGKNVGIRRALLLKKPWQYKTTTFIEKSWLS
jgi:hypothetical protein